MKEKNVCSNCIDLTGGCCTNVNLVIHISEAQPFSDAIEKNFFPKDHALESLKDENNLFFYQILIKILFKT